MATFESIVKVVKEDKPYIYCPECGYIGTKENPKGCNHFRYKQIMDFEPDRHNNEGVYLVSTHLSNFIYKNTWMTSKLKAEDTGILTIQMYFTKTMSKKPRSTTYRTIEILTKLGFNLEFYDRPEIDADNFKLVQLLSEIHTRIKKTYRRNDPTKFIIAKDDSNIIPWWDRSVYDIQLTDSFPQNMTTRYNLEESDFGNKFPPVVYNLSHKFLVETDYAFVDENVTKVFTYANTTDGNLVRLQQFDLL